MQTAPRERVTSAVPRSVADPAGGPREGRILDYLVQFIERTYGEDLAARVEAINTGKNDAGYDPFGFDPETTRTALALVTFLHRTYFRTQTFGLENVPRGRALFVANHSGQVPLDGALISAALMLDVNPPVLVRSMVEKWTQTLPFFATWFPRLGQVVGVPENARRLLTAEHPLLVFPEGIRGISKPFHRRYQLEAFGLGFMRLALETGSPIVPVGVIGGEEQYPSVANLKGVARVFGMPALPVLPQLLLGVPLPLPTRYRLYFGEPLWFDGDPDEDDALIEPRVQKVRQAVEGLIQKGLRERKHVFW
jgi:1-acyl-sn-glycerol-3-phosphate acyltransferase